MTEADRKEIHSDDFQTVLRALLAAYQPWLEAELRHAKSPEELKKAAESTDPNCEEEVALAERLFGPFLTEDVVMRLLGPQGREVMGPVKSWWWCFEHLRCCLIFGWLVCRGPRTFRAFAYYLYRYFRCVRLPRRTDTANQPEISAELRRDFQKLIEALAGAYKPYLTDQFAGIEFPAGIPDEVLDGKIDCFEGEQDTAAIFERLLTVNTAPYLFGEKMYAEISKQPTFRYCRCLCLCAIRFGCCLARARSFVQALRCLLGFFRCVRRCFHPLIGEIDTPAEGACAGPVFLAACGDLTAIEITGTAAGSSFDHYTLRYSWGANPPINDAVVYPDCSHPPAAPSYGTAVTGATLGYLDTALLPPGITEFTVYLDVYGSGGAHLTDSHGFELKTTAVEITQVAQVGALVGEDPFNLGSTTKLIKSVNDANPAVPETSVGGGFTITGSAYTVGCNRIMTQYMLARFNSPPAAPVPTFGSAAGGSTVNAPVVYADSASHPWQSGCFPVSTPNIILNGNLVAYWSALSCAFPAPHTVPKVVGKTWDSTALNGRFVLLVETRDRLLPGGAYPGTVAAVDQVAVWIDNYDPTALITSIGGISGCGDLHLKDFVGKTAQIRGVAYDPPIDPTAPQQKPNDNFGSYSLWFQKNGGAGGTIPGATPTARVPNVWPGPPGGDGALANWDIVGALDAGVGPPLPPTSPQLRRGERCAYVFELQVLDQTHVGDSGSVHHREALYAINIINDIP
ncbi:MAG: hypothetical protein LAQ30_13915 [Acidobacteriia bacterium]|nr:hypothetical protein [Terriglobia bacterium]